MFMMFVTAIPVIGFIMLLVWAFVGDNESRKNYFRAILVWIGIFICVGVLLMATGALPELTKQLQHGAHKP
jgi:hypothetical protein